MATEKIALEVKLRAEVNGLIKDQFEAIKKAKGLSSNAECLRLIISEFYQVLKDRGLIK